MISPCGPDCAACHIHKAANDPQFAEQLAADWRKAGHAKAEAGWFQCQGCHGPDNLVWGGDCAIRKCCLKDRELSNCSPCPGFPCTLVTDFESDGSAHHKTAVENLRRMKNDRSS